MSFDTFARMGRTQAAAVTRVDLRRTADHADDVPGPDQGKNERGGNSPRPATIAAAADRSWQSLGRDLRRSLVRGANCLPAAVESQAASLGNDSQGSPAADPDWPGADCADGRHYPHANAARDPGASRASEPPSRTGLHDRNQQPRSYLTGCE